MIQILQFMGTTLRRIQVRERWVFAGLLCAMLAGATTVPRAITAFTFFGPFLNCELCGPQPYIESVSLGSPLRTLVGATWVPSPNGTPYAGGVRSGETVRFHLDLQDANTQAGTTHFLVVFTTAATGGKPGLLHVRDTSPGAKGEIKMLAQPPIPATASDTNLIERVYRTPGADNTLTGYGTGPSADPLPWDHPI